MAISTISNANAITYAGAVLQVVQGTLSSMVSTTSNGTFVTTGLAATITPKFSNSKIIATVSSTGFATAVNAQCCVTLYRNSTNLSASGFANIYWNGGTSGQSLAGLTFQCLDSPATTASTTYTVYFQNANTTNSVQFNAGALANTQIGSIILMEIAG